MDVVFQYVQRISTRKSMQGNLSNSSVGEVVKEGINGHLWENSAELSRLLTVLSGGFTSN